MVIDQRLSRRADRPHNVESRLIAVCRSAWAPLECRIISGVVLRSDQPLPFGLFTIRAFAARSAFAWGRQDAAYRLTGPFQVLFFMGYHAVTGWSSRLSSRTERDS